MVTFAQAVPATELEALGILRAEAALYRQVMEARQQLEAKRGLAGWPLVQQWYEHWFKQRYVTGAWAQAMKKGSEKHYAKHYNLVKSDIGHLSMDLVTPPIINRLFTKLRSQGYSSGYLRDTYVVLDRMFNDAIRFGYDDGDGRPQWRARWNPMESIVKPKPVREEKPILSDEMMVELLRRSMEAHAAEPELPFTTCAIALQMLLGLRVSEATMLRWEQLKLHAGIDGAVGSLHWAAGERKWGQPLIAALPAEALRFIPMHRRQAEGRIWTAQRAANHALEHVNAEIRARAQEMGLPDFTSHSLRHSFSFALLKGGASMDLLQQALGHASIRTTEEYVKNVHARAEAARKTAQVTLPRAAQLLGGE